MRSRIVQIGKSQGIRVPKSLLKKAQLEDAVEITVVGSALVVRSPKHPARQGWAEAARREMGDDLPRRYS